MELLAEGREAEVYASGGGTVLKLYRPGFASHVTEAAALRALSGLDVAPALVDTVTRDGRDGLVLERVAGTDMLALLGRQPWRLAGLAGALARAQLRVHATPAPAELPDLRAVLAERIGAADLPDALRDHTLRILDSLPAGDRLCHGDLHPGNAIVGTDRITVIDWTNAARGEPAADLARTLFLLRQAEPLAGTPWRDRVLIGTGRRLFAGAFRRAYRRGGTEPVERVGDWGTVQVAARLAEGLDVERPALLRLLERVRHRAGS